MKTTDSLWFESDGNSQNIESDKFNRLVNLCEEAKVPYKIEEDINFKDNDELRTVYKTITIEGCWLQTILTKVLDY